MKRILPAIAALAFISYGCGADEKTSNLTTSGEHFQATQCEIHLTGVHVWRSSHNIKTIEFLLATSADIETQGIDVVGMRNAATYDTTLSAELDYDHRDEAASLGDDGLYHLTKSVSGEFGSAVFRGAFFVRTKSGTNYWLQSAPYSDYIVDEDLFTHLLQNSQTPELGHAEVLVNENARLQAFDPHGCAN